MSFVGEQRSLNEMWNENVYVGENCGNLIFCVEMSSFCLENQY
jgi:hypothetical protein